MADKRKKKSSSKHTREIPSSQSPGTSTQSEEAILVDNSEEESSGAKSISIQASRSRTSSYGDMDETNDESFLRKMHNSAMENPEHSQWDPNYSTFSTPANKSKSRTSTPSTLRSRKSDLSWSERDEQREYYYFKEKEGKIQYKNDIVPGLENASTSIKKLFSGENKGKLIIQVSEDPTS